MVETSPSSVQPDIRTEEEKLFDSLTRRYSDIPEPVPEKDNPNALFANGWGRRGHFALLVAPSGIGKSVISTQILIPWAQGKPALVGSAPLLPLKIAVIQAEDDDTEMAEFRRDHRMGHVAEGMSIDDILKNEKSIYDWSPFFRGKVGDGFLRGLDLALRRQPADVVIMNPLQSYTEIDLNKNKEITEFLRNGIDPLLAKFRVFMLCIHHTNKPQINTNSKGNAFGDDAMAAYVGAGGAELTNYARSVTFIRRCTEKECPVENSFFLIGAKRGNRLGWKDAEGKKTNRRIIAYSDGYIHWREVTKEEIEKAASPTAARLSADETAERLSPEEVADRIAAVIRADWPKSKVWQYCHDKLRKNMSNQDFNDGWKHFVANFRSYGFSKVDSGRGSYHFVHDPDAMQDDLDGLDLNDSQPYFN